MKQFFLIIITFSISILNAQNLVLNGGFEENYGCPKEYNSNKTKVEIAPYWESPSYGTPDLFNTCSDKMGDRNILGVTKPSEGNGFAGLVTWSDKGFREYLRGELKKPLKKGVKYRVKFYYRLTSYSNYSCDRIGFALTEKTNFIKSDKAMPISAIQRIKQKAFTSLSGSWELVDKVYTAQGGEKYITLGNFSSNSRTKYFHLYWQKDVEPMLHKTSYYYIDDVSVAELKPIIEEKNIFTTDSVYTFKDLYFESASYTIDSSAYPELDNLVTYLKSNQKKVLIEGHTDKVGSVNDNLLLSRNRAKAVKLYLVKQGVSSNRIKYIGYGAARPISIDSNKNRRVEYTFKQ